MGDKNPKQRAGSCKFLFHVFNEKWCEIMKPSDESCR